MACNRAARRTENTRQTTGRIVPLDDLLGWQTAEVITPPDARRHAIRNGMVATVLLGVFFAALALPFAGAGALTLREARSYWDAMPATLPDVPVPTRSVMLAADGTKIAQFYAENRVPVAIDEVPQVMQDAIVAIEDARFYDHHGIDARGIARAAASNLLSDSTQGGSTLTQQYVKNRLASAAEDDTVRREVTSRTSYVRKLREAKLAIELERTWPKAKVLEGYLNISYFGDGAYGIGTAARHYFGKQVADLNLAEAALLAGLVQNPHRLDPTQNPEGARQRRNVVLDRMRDLGYITAARHAHATAQPVRLNLTRAANGCHASRYPFFCQWVKQQLENDPAFGKTQAQRNERLFRGGMTIRTTLDPKKQAVAQAAVDRALGRDNRVAAASVTVEPGTGRVVAMAVNRTFGTPKKDSFAKTEVLLPTVKGMQPGSNFKPITLAAALERGFDPATVISAPYRYTPAGQAAPPGGFSNYSTSSGGRLNAYQAIARSSNTWFIRLQEQIGVLNVVSMAERLGITSIPRTGARAITERDASLTLGAFEVSPVELAGAYAAFAAHGVHCTPHPIVAATGPDGKPITVPSPDCHEAIPASVADTVAATMQGTLNGPDPYRTGKEEYFGRPAAGKTGTTQNTAAVWFSGFTPQYATSVWVGDPRGGFKHPLRGFYAYGSYVAKASGGSVAGPIWREVMAGVHAGLPVKQFSRPAATVSAGTVVPDVRGLTLEQAYRALTDAGYTVRLAPANAKPDTALSPNRVALTTPAAGSFLGLASEVVVTMTAGSDRGVRLPDTTKADGADETSAPADTRARTAATR